MPNRAAEVAGFAAGCAAALGLAAGGFAYAARWPTSQLFGRTLLAGDDPDEISLTYDDGPNPAATGALLEVLARHSVRATFFLVGQFVAREPGLAREIAAAGHTLGNHTQTHPGLGLRSEAGIREELRRCSSTLEDTVGQRVRFFRPPFGSRRPAVLRIAREMGMVPVMWNVTAYDWEPLGVDAILGNVERGIARNRGKKRGSNVLLHDGGHLGLNAARMDSVAATERLLAAHSGTGSRFVTVEGWA